MEPVPGLTGVYRRFQKEEEFTVQKCRCGYVSVIRWVGQRQTLLKDFTVTAAEDPPPVTWFTTVSC